MKNILIQIIHMFFVLRAYIERTLPHENVFIFDLDNTLADTWPYLENGILTKRSAIRLPIQLNVLKRLNEVKGKGRVVILTARPYKLFFETKKWLKKNHVDYDALFIVKHPHQKIQLLSIIDKKINMYDDLSHSHEKGMVKHYENVIEEIQKMSHVNLITGNELKDLQNGL